MYTCKANLKHIEHGRQKRRSSHVNTYIKKENNQAHII